MKIASVIVTYNRLAKLKKSIQRTLEEKVDYIVVVNNASTDGTKEWLDSIQNPKIKAIHLTENTGGAGGFHVGFKEVVEKTDANWLVCYDDDAYPYQGSIETFKSLAASLLPSVSSLAAAVYLPDGTIAEMNRPSLNPFWHLTIFFQTMFKGRKGFHIPNEAYQSDALLEIDASSFVGYFIRTEVIKKVGLPRKEFFIYADDVVYTLMVKKGGYSHFFSAKIKFVHDTNTLVKQQPIYHPLWKVYYTYRNGIELYRYASGIFFYPIVILRIIEWYRRAKHYENPVLYKKIMKQAVLDGLKRNFSKTHREIENFCQN